MIKPRFLRYLRLNDEPPNEQDDLTIDLPVEVIDLGQWFDFCQKLSRQHRDAKESTRGVRNLDMQSFLHHEKAWDYELLTIDFNFRKDTSGPWFPRSMDSDPREENADFLADPNLELLRWPDSLVPQIGPNTGLLIGSHLVAHSAPRDIPCGVAFHTYHKDIVIYDTPSAMLATQMLLASGVDIPTRDLRETMSRTIELIRESVKQPAFGIGTAAERFRHAFLRRAGASGLEHEGPVRLWVEPASLWALLDICSAAKSDKELNAKLEKFGLEFYDRNGAIHSLDLRSMFLDRLIYRTKEGNFADVRRHIPLADAKPAADGQIAAGVLWQFIETLAAQTPSNIAPVLDFFRASEGDREPTSINVAVKRDIHRLLALVFAWLDLFADEWSAEQSRSYDPFKKEFGGAYSTLIQQVGALLRIYDLTRDEGWKVEDRDFDPKADFLPLSHKEDHSISEVVREHGGEEGSHLYRSMRYDKADLTGLSQKRIVALEHLLAIAARWQCVEIETNEKTGKPTGRYRLKRIDVPEERPGGPDQRDIAQRLGFNLKRNQDPSKQLGRIIQDTPGFEEVGVTEFLNSLTERPLPNHLKWLAWEFMEEFWGPGTGRPLPYEAWPVCLSEVGREHGETSSLVEWRRKSQKSQEAARSVQSRIIPPNSLVTAGGYEIWCSRRSAEDVGGDYYRVKKVSDGEYRIYIGDACGIGLPAALLVQQIHGIITMLEEQVESPAELCTKLDSRLYEQTFGEGPQEEVTANYQWATLICTFLDTHANRLTFANAAHPGPVLVHKDGGVSILAHALDLPSFAVGQYARSVYGADTVDLIPGDRIVFFTDGVSEALEGELLKCIVENRKLSAKKLGEALMRKVAKAKSDDDQTLIVLSLD